MDNFYVYFDEQHNIISVSGGKDTTSNDRFATFPKEEVIGFMDGTLALANYYIIENRKTGKVTLQEKITNEVSVQTLDDKLYKIQFLTNDDFDVKITKDNKNKTINFELNANKRKDLLGDASDITINGANVLDFFITKQDDPHFFLKHIRIDIIDFIKNDIKLEYTEDLNNTSMYTKRVYEHYTFTEIK